uniref:Uncharacterized protein n=1 Tax=Aegilops tauschii subsp. strangulata TaxID=200361 RepID=A0A452Y405_AEGTS
MKSMLGFHLVDMEIQLQKTCLAATRICKLQ